MPVASASVSTRAVSRAVSGAVLACVALLAVAVGVAVELLPAGASAQDAGVQTLTVHRTRHVRRARRPQVSARYRRMRARWHLPASPRERDRWAAILPRPPLVLALVATNTRVELTPDRDDGGFDADDLLRAEEVLAARRSGARHAIDAGVLDRVYRAQRHFRVPFVWVVSGFREDRATSRHTMGRAMDVVLPGVRDTLLADHFRAEGFSGVGTYSVGGFVHVDVRNRSYFWLDGTSPGRRSRARRVLLSRAWSADARARARGVEPPLPPTSAEDETDDDEAAVDAPGVIEVVVAEPPPLASAPPDAGTPAAHPRAPDAQVDAPW